MELSVDFDFEDLCKKYAEKCSRSYSYQSREIQDPIRCLINGTRSYYETASILVELLKEISDQNIVHKVLVEYEMISEDEA
jgi:hypothetical protein